MGLTQFDERTPIQQVAQIVAADTTTLKSLNPQLFLGGVRLDNILLTNTDGIDHVVDFWITVSAVNYLLGSIHVPAGTGKGGVAAIDAIPLLIPAGQVGYLGTNNSQLYFSVEVTVVTGSVQAVSLGGFL